MSKDESNLKLLIQALENLLDAPELNMDDKEPETQRLCDEANAALEHVRAAYL